MTARFSSADALKTARQEWLSVLVRVPADAVIDSAQQFSFEVSELKAPEVGMLMTDARVHASGPGFHLGEVTLTRCVLKDELGILDMDKFWVEMPIKRWPLHDLIWRSSARIRRRKPRNLLRCGKMRLPLSTRCKVSGSMRLG